MGKETFQTGGPRPYIDHPSAGQTDKQENPERFASALDNLRCAAGGVQALLERVRGEGFCGIEATEMKTPSISELLAGGPESINDLCRDINTSVEQLHNELYGF